MRWLILVVTVFLIAGCITGDDDDKPDLMTIYGRVTTGQSAGVANVRVIAYLKRTNTQITDTTDAKGWYGIAVPDTGLYTVSYYSPGYSQQSGMSSRYITLYTFDMERLNVQIDGPSKRLPNIIATELNKIY